MINKRHRYDSGQYTILPRAVVNNQSLSFAARGLLLYLLEKPADWCVANEVLYRASPGGERHINTLLTELKAHGYVHREKVYDPPTRTFRWDTTVFDFPEDNPHFDHSRIPTFRMDTERTHTERRDTKRSDDLILDPLIDHTNTPACDPEQRLSTADSGPTLAVETLPTYPATVPPRVRAGLPPSGPSLLERRPPTATPSVRRCCRSCP